MSATCTLSSVASWASGQQFVSPFVLAHRRGGTLHRVNRHRSPSLSQVRSVSSGTSSRAANSRWPRSTERRRPRSLYMLRTPCHWRLRIVKRLPAFMAGTRTPIEIQEQRGNSLIARTELLKNAESDRSISVHISRTSARVRSECCGIWRVWRARQGSNLRPPA